MKNNYIIVLLMLNAFLITGCNKHHQQEVLPERMKKGEVKITMHNNNDDTSYIKTPAGSPEPIDPSASIHRPPTNLLPAYSFSSGFTGPTGSSPPPTYSPRSGPLMRCQGYVKNHTCCLTGVISCVIVPVFIVGAWGLGYGLDLMHKGSNSTLW